MLESLYNKVAGLKMSKTLLKRDSNTPVFPIKIWEMFEGYHQRWRVYKLPRDYIYG